MDKFCDKCNVTVRGKMQICPLCQNRLSGGDSKPCYPEIKTLYKQFERFFKIVIISAIGLGVAAVSVNILMPHKGFWSLFVLLGIVCFWIMLNFSIGRRYNITKKITTQAVVISILSVVWDFATEWHGWSVDFVIPITFATAMVSLGVISQVMRLPVTDYMSAMLADVLFGIVPVIFYVTGILHVRIPSVVCLALSVISFFAILIFEGHNMIVEIQKKIHL